MKNVLTLLTVGSAIPLYAHPGHDLFERGARHVVTSPFHLAVLMAMGVALAVAARFVPQTHTRTLLRIGSVSCLMLALMLALLR